MELLQTLNPENALEEEWQQYPVREAVRAVVIDENNQVALLHVTKHQFYKLPGGGVEKTEDYPQALQRECQEEIGCSVEVLGEVGSIIEYRKFCSLKQISFCYFARVLGEKGAPQFMADEIEDGFSPVWVPYEEAVALMTASEALDLEGKQYIVPRDTLLLQSARQFITKG